MQGHHAVGCVVIALATLCQQLHLVNGVLADSPSRATLSKRGYFTAKQEENAIYCGGHQHQELTEYGSNLGTSEVTKAFNAGGPATFEVDSSAISGDDAYIEFKICPSNNSKEHEPQECFDSHPVSLEDGSGTRCPLHKGEKIQVRVKIPGDINCNFCVLQYHIHDGFVSEHLKERPSGHDFYGCSDISVFHDNHGASHGISGPLIDGIIVRGSANFGNIFGKGSFITGNANAWSQNIQDNWSQSQSGQSLRGGYSQSSIRGPLIKGIIVEGSGNFGNIFKENSVALGNVNAWTQNIGHSQGNYISNAGEHRLSEIIHGRSHGGNGNGDLVVVDIKDLDTFLVIWCAPVTTPSPFTSTVTPDTTLPLFPEEVIICNDTTVTTPSPVHTTSYRPPSPFPTITFPPITFPPITFRPITFPTFTFPPITIPPKPFPTASFRPITFPTITIPPITIPPKPYPTITFPPFTRPTITFPPFTRPTITFPPFTRPTITFPPFTRPTITFPPFTRPTIPFRSSTQPPIPAPTFIPTVYPPGYKAQWIVGPSAHGIVVNGSANFGNIFRSGSISTGNVNAWSQKVVNSASYAHDGKASGISGSQSIYGPALKEAFINAAANFGNIFGGGRVSTGNANAWSQKVVNSVSYGQSQGYQQPAGAGRYVNIQYGTSAGGQGAHHQQGDNELLLSR